MITANNKVHAILLLVIALSLGGCSTAPIVKPEGAEIVPPEFSADRVLGEDVETVHEVLISDPWEGFNRTMYRFNYRFDRYVFLPAVSAYQAVTPDPLEQGFSNFFRNIRDITTLINSVLQLNLEKTMNTTTRLMINSTVGLAGFLEIATDVPRSDEDFGQTLGYWGVGNGPFLILPILGPSNLRDGSGAVVDLGMRFVLMNALDPFENCSHRDAYSIGLMLLEAIDTRHRLSFRYYGSGSPFEYELIRFLYTQMRRLQIEK